MTLPNNYRVKCVYSQTIDVVKSQNEKSYLYNITYNFEKSFLSDQLDSASLKNKIAS